MKYRLRYLLLIFCFALSWIDVDSAFVEDSLVSPCSNDTVDLLLIWDSDDVLPSPPPPSGFAPASWDRSSQDLLLRRAPSFNPYIDFDSTSNGLKFRCDYKYCRTCKGWFKYHKIPATFHDARLRCDFEGAILASPTTPEIRSVMARSNGRIPVLTGIHATFSQGDYTTVDGIPLEEIPHEWIRSESSNDVDTESCISINAKGSLADVPCDVPRPYMCFRDKIGELNACGTPDPEYRLDSETQKCYKFHTVPRTFKRAYMACSAEGGHLLIINSEEEAKAIRDLFEKYPAEKMIGEFSKEVAFVGVTDWNEHGDWRTIHGQTLTEAGYDKFAEGEPSNSTSTEFCVTVMRSGLLNDSSCEDYYAFICEKRPEYPPVCSITL